MHMFQLMTRRVPLALGYAGALAVVMALANIGPGISGAPLVVVWIVAPVVGYLVGRWWVLLALVGVLMGRTIGWDPGENDGNPALWLPYVVSSVAFFGLPLLGGVLLSYTVRWLPAEDARN